MSSGERQDGEAAAEEGANSLLSFNALCWCLCGGRSPCQELGPAFLCCGCAWLSPLCCGALMFCTAATNVRWALQLRCQDDCQGFGFLVPRPRLGRNLRPGKPWPQGGLDGHLWAWMGTLAKPSLGGRGQSWVCSGSLLDLGCHLAAGASPGWVSAQGQGHPGAMVSSQSQCCGPWAVTLHLPSSPSSSCP